MSQQHASKKKRYDNEDAELLGKVSSRLITKETLKEKLAQHVEKVSSALTTYAKQIGIFSSSFLLHPVLFWKFFFFFWGGVLCVGITYQFCDSIYLQVDYEMALEYATQSGVSEEPREDIYLQSLEADDNFIDLHSPIFVFRLFH